MDLAFRPVIARIASTVSSVLANENQFGQYYIRNQFILGDIYNFLHDSLLHQKISQILQEAADASIQNKELGTFSHVMLKSTDCLFQPRIGDRHFLHESFRKGCLHQVSRENYGLDFYLGRTQDDLKVSYNDGAIENTIEPNEIMVILQRGQSITNEGVTVTFSVQLKSTRHKEQVHIRKFESCFFYFYLSLSFFFFFMKGC